MPIVNSLAARGGLGGEGTRADRTAVAEAFELGEKSGSGFELDFVPL